MPHNGRLRTQMKPEDTPLLKIHLLEKYTILVLLDFNLYAIFCLVKNLINKH